jgi:carboxymethylenebutenolidase
MTATPTMMAVKTLLASGAGWVNGAAGIIGTCSGGRHALLAASRAPGFDAVADLRGPGGDRGQGGAVAGPPGRADRLHRTDRRAPTRAVRQRRHASSPAQVDQYDAELMRHGKAYEFHRYDGRRPWHLLLPHPDVLAGASDGRLGKVFGLFRRDLSG